jgi:Family of unknown function (DUF6498)
MSEATAMTGPAERSIRDKLLLPSTLWLLATDAIPIFGVLFWHWDAMLMLLLYWSETGAIGFWAMTAYLFRPGYDKDDKGRTGWRAYLARAWIVTIMSAVAALFMTVHMAILQEIFRDRWPAGIDGVADFIDKILIATWLWVPLLAMFLFRGAMYLKTRIDPQTMRRLLPRLAAVIEPKSAVALTPTQLRDAATDSAVRFFGRIFLMQISLLLGGLLAIRLGNLVPAILLIAIKSTIDLLMHVGGEANAGN